ncbi:MAG: NADH-quinone oxidoreductase subunit [Fimbriimonadaceae bacterium]|jgi:NADH-quinone oxidoreductase subunit H|nr:NADH-quinone oxidoreductase subunit [Fimbriimonadaceae bacterium]
MTGLLTNFYADALTRDTWWIQLIRVLLLIVPILTLVPGLIWWERRLLSWMQDRVGPNRVGPWGLLQPIADGVKLFFKEDITPAAVDRAIYFMAPAIALFPAFALGATMPWGSVDPDSPYRLLTPVADVPIGILYMMAVSSLGVYGVVLGGYASNNKYSLLGGLRSSAQLISYELAMGVSLACIVLASGSLRMTDMVKVQEGPLWGIGGLPIQNWFFFTPYGFLAGVIFLICMVAETNRAPFDLPEAENELIAGYHTEYSSMKFAVYFMGEYAAMFVFSGIFAAVFLGGWNPLPIRWEAIGLGGLNHFLKILGPLFFITKMAFGISVYIWLRATLPRLRYDQLMDLGWKSLLPLAALNLIGIATWQYVSSVYGAGTAIPVGTAFVILAAIILGFVLITRKANARDFKPRTVRYVDAGKGSVEVAETGAPS